jgi:hypothetical protein
MVENKKVVVTYTRLAEEVGELNYRYEASVLFEGQLYIPKGTFSMFEYSAKASAHAGNKDTSNIDWNL